MDLQVLAYCHIRPHFTHGLLQDRCRGKNTTDNTRTLGSLRLCYCNALNEGVHSRPLIVEWPPFSSLWIDEYSALLPAVSTMWHISTDFLFTKLCSPKTSIYTRMSYGILLECCCFQWFLSRWWDLTWNEIDFSIVDSVYVPDIVQSSVNQMKRFLPCVDICSSLQAPHFICGCEPNWNIILNSYSLLERGLFL